MKKRFALPTPESLAAAAAHYLERYAASEASVRRVLEGRLRRAGLHHPAFAQDAAAQNLLREEIDRIVARFVRAGALDDATFAEIKVNSLRRQGRSARAIVERLRAKGVPPAHIQKALVQHAEDKPLEDAEFAAALALARRRKLGPFRQGAADEDRQRKDFAVLARAGFSSAITRRILREGFHEAFED